MFTMVAIVVVLLVSEVILRHLGYIPWKPAHVSIRIEPGGSLSIKHPVLGYTHRPGRFRITLPTGYSFIVTHGEDTLRISAPIKPGSPDGRGRQIWVFGCSFTHGWSLNDWETYPWQLQTKLPNYTVRNWGVSGYGTLQSFLQLRSALASGDEPHVVIMTYASFHDERNTLLRKVRKQFVAWTRTPANDGFDSLIPPYARLDEEGDLLIEMTDTLYTEFPWMRHSALIHLLEVNYNAFEAPLVKSAEVTKAIIRRAAQLCKNRGIPLVVAGISADRHTRGLLEYWRRQGMMTVDISVDLRIRKNLNLPHDIHPSPLANQKYATKLAAYLDELLEGQKRPFCEMGGTPLKK